MSFRLYDSRTRTTSDFTPLVEGQVSIYHCGLTVQSSPHLGHIRKEVVFDVLRRWLTHSGYQVSIVANVTDIDDKILAKSAERGVPWYAHAYEFERELHEAYSSLGCALPTYEPRATGHIPEMIELIGELVEAGHAYPAPDGSGDVYFDVRSWPEYGELSHMAIDDMEPAADAEPRGKRDPRDFALWKGHKDGEPETASWPSPWGRGRPGWHIECSAMAGKYLGDSFDIHGGGIDLRFPHHENELAQSRAAGRGFARYWMHNAWVTAAGEKMSKSLSNGALVKDVTRQYPARAVRLYLLQPHYRSTIEYSQTSLAEATAQLARLDGFLDRATSAIDGADLDAEVMVLPEAFTRAMDDDLGTPQAVAVLFNLVKEGNQLLEQGGDVRPVLGQVYAILDVLGLDPRSPQWATDGGGEQQLRPVVDGLVQALLDQRADARGRRDWAAADAIRDRLAELGLKVEDTPNGARWSLETRADKGTSGAGQEA